MTFCRLKPKILGKECKGCSTKRYNSLLTRPVPVVAHASGVSENRATPAMDAFEGKSDGAAFPQKASDWSKVLLALLKNSLDYDQVSHKLMYGTLNTESLHRNIFDQIYSGKKAFLRN